MIEIKAYKNINAIAVRQKRNSLIMSNYFVIIGIIISVIGIIVQNYKLLFFWIMPLFLILNSFITFSNIMTSQQKPTKKANQRHIIKIDENKLYIDQNEIKYTKYIRIKEYKTFIFLEILNDCFIIPKAELKEDKNLILSKLKQIKKTKKS